MDSRVDSALVPHCRHQFADCLYRASDLTPSRYVGRVGTGFADALLRDLAKLLEAQKTHIPDQAANRIIAALVH